MILQKAARKAGAMQENSFTKNTKSLHSHFASVLILFVWGGGVEREQPSFKKKKQKTTGKGMRC